MFCRWDNQKEVFESSALMIVKLNAVLRNRMEKYYS
jgi:hypothetical protein